MKRGRTAGPVRVGELVDAFLSKGKIGRQVRRVGVLDEWEERVGERIAAVTRPRSLSDTVLFVEVRTSPWLMELNMMREGILERLNEGREDVPIKKIVFVLMDGG
jgi:predicted nucleic acid-binding Zn ribbon protein